MNIIINAIQQGTLLNVPLYLKYKDKLSSRDIALNFGFISGVCIPTAYFYLKFLTSARQKFFPEFNESQIKHFSLMYFANKQAIIFDAFLIHFLYYGFIGVSLFSLCQYLYSYKPKEENQDNIKKSLINLIKLRCGLSVISFLVDIWLPQTELWAKNFPEDPKQLLISKRFQFLYLCKMQIFTAIWHMGIISEYFKYCDQDY